jgi:hypothetical protein
MHPMRVLFKIPKAPSPALTDTQKWSDDFHSALAASVIKSPADRPTARELLAMPFYKGQTDKSPLRDLFKLCVDARATCLLTRCRYTLSCV